MPSTLVTTYDLFSNADHARTALIEAGFEPSKLHLNVNNDEAGPVEGNFTVGNPSPTDKENNGGISGFFKSLVGIEKTGDEDYQETYQNVVQRAAYVLIIEADNEQESQYASDVAHRHGAVMVDHTAGRDDLSYQTGNRSYRKG